MSDFLLIGREPERARLAEVVQRAGERGGALTLHGEAGIGKSALLAEAGALAAARGMRVLAAVGLEAERQLPYAGLNQILYPVRAAADALAGSQRAAIRSAIGLADQVASDSRMIGFAALQLLAGIAAQTPILLLVDDAHWLDPASADALSFIARRLESEPMALIAATREGTPSRLVGSGFPSMAVGRLSHRASAALLDAAAPGLGPAMRRRLLDEAAGNPLALTELPKTVQAADLSSRSGLLPLTERLERAFTAQTDRLPANTRAVLTVAALNDSAAAAETLDAATSILGTRQGPDSLTPAVLARLIVFDGDAITFRHPLMRSAISQTTSAEQRQRIHAALAEALRAQADRRSWHLAAATAGADDDVAAELEATGDRARRRGDVATAVAAFEHAARLSANPADRVDRSLRAADLAADSGEPDVVARLLAEVGTLDQTRQQRARAAWIRDGLDSGTREDTTSPLELARLAQTVADSGDTDLAARILERAASRCLWSEPGTQARGHVQHAADALFVDKRDPRLLAILAYAAPIDRGAEVVDGLKRLAEQPVSGQFGEHFLGSAALLVGMFDVAARSSARALPGLRSQSRRGLLAMALATQAWSSVRLGDLDTAAHAAEEARQVSHLSNQPHLYGIARASQAEIAALRGDFARSEDLAAEAERVSIATGARPVLAMAQLARGQSALGEGRFADAFAYLRRMHDPADPAFHAALRCYAVPELVEAAIRSGHVDDVTGIVSELERLTLSTTSPALAAGLRYARAVLAGGNEAEARFTEALGVDLCRWPLQRARLQLAFGEWLRRRRRASESRPHLRTARETFIALGMAPLSERAQSELRATGEGAPHRAHVSHDQLTAQEMHIAQLAAEGLTNRQIGQRLYLSHRTVSTHLHRIFPKLSITSRVEIRTAIHRLDA